MLLVLQNLVSFLLQKLYLCGPATQPNRALLDDNKSTIPDVRFGFTFSTSFDRIVCYYTAKIL